MAVVVPTPAFTLISNEWITDRRISPVDFRVACYVSHGTKPDDRIDADHIALHLGLSPQDAQASLDRLADLGGFGLERDEDEGAVR